MTQAKRKTGLPRLIEIAGAKSWWLFGSILLAVCAAIAQFVPYVAVYKILIELAAHAREPRLADRRLIEYWAAASCVAVLAYGALLYASTMLSHIAAFNILYEMRMALAHKLNRLPLGFFTRRASGEIKKVMSEDVERVELFVAHHVPDIATAVVFPLLVLGYLFSVDWRLTLVIVAVYAGALIAQSRMYLNSSAAQTMKDYHAALGRMNASIVEYVRGIQVVKVFSRSLDSLERMRRDIFAYRDYAVGITRRFSSVYTTFLTVLSSTLLLLVPVAVILLLRSASYPTYVPTVFLFLLLGAGSFFPLLKLMWVGGLLAQNSTGVALIDDILDRPEIEEPATPHRPQDATLEFDNVSFSYGQGDVLQRVSFAARPGTVTALVGPSGAGKSTVAMLAARFWDVTDGQVRVGGADIRTVSSDDLMKHVAFVFQDSLLFFDTIEENIRMGNRSATREDVVHAAKAAHCHEFIEKLERGYDTLVGEGGIYLSGGEQQRIALARAILKDAPIVVLDEATAYADPENEGKILASFAHLIRGKTVLVVAHRLSTITSADQILVLDEGAIVERGGHEELLAKEGVYARMWRIYARAREWTIAKGAQGES
jgi:ATP-binding cassette subfamily B protein IrtA